MSAGAVHVRRLHHRSASGDEVVDRLRLGALLAGAAVDPPGLPPAAVLCVRRLADPLPGRLPLGELAPPREWEAAVAGALERERRGAARPALGFVPAGATAVLFADRAELLACLAADWLSGELALRWWWAGLIEVALPRRDAVALAWREEPRYVPAALELLSARGLAVAFARALGRFETARLAEATAVAHGRPELAEPIARAAPAPPGSRAVPRASVVAGPRPAVAVSDAGEPPAGRALAAPARSPARARREDPPPATARPLDPPSPPSPPRAVSPSPPAGDGGRTGSDPPAAPPRSMPAAAAAPHRVGAARVEPPAPSSPPPAVAGPAPAASVEPLLAVARALRPGPAAPSAAPHAPAPERAAPPPPAAPPASAAEDVRAAPWTPAAEPAAAPPGATPRADDRAAPATSPLAAAPEPPASPAADVVLTELGGLFFLVNVGIHLGLIADFTEPRAPGLDPFELVTLLGRELVEEPDPIWPLLAALAGRELDEPAGAGFDPGPWRMPPGWLEPWREAPARPWTFAISGGRLRVRHPAGFLVVDEPARRTALVDARARYGAPPMRLGRVLDAGGRGTPARRWARLLAAYARPRLQLALGAGDPVALLRRPARVYVTAAHVDVELELAAHPLELRLAGLDRDPGWLPASTRRLAFHFR